MLQQDDQKRRITSSRPISLAPLTPDQALAAALQVKKADVDALGRQGKAKKKRAAKKK